MLWIGAHPRDVGALQRVPVAAGVPADVLYLWPGAPLPSAASAHEARVTPSSTVVVTARTRGLVRDEPWAAPVEREDYTDQGTVDAEDLAADASPPTSGRITAAADWPAPLGTDAYHGVLGDLVKAVEPHSEADPAALLLQALVMVGNVVGPAPHFYAGGARHALVLFVVIVGLTSKGRKGTSYNAIKHPLRAVDPSLDDPERVLSGLSSGEGLIWSVRDAVHRGDHVDDPGVHDKRKLVVEGEFASVLKQFSRDGNILSAVIRQAWDSGSLGTLTKSNHAKATDAHISIVGHITKDELLRYLNATEAGNGFGNRFLWVCTKRSKLLPEGGELHRVDFGPIVRQLIAVREFARACGELRRDDAARALWAEIYGALSEGKPGMFGAMTSRAEAQVMRIACIYALGDMSYVVTPAHLRAGLAVWRYCEDSTRFIFGASLGDPVADEIDGVLRAAGLEGLTRTDIRDYFGRNRASHEIVRALTLLEEHGRAKHIEDRSGRGRPVERWYHIAALKNYDINDISPIGK